MLVFFKSRPNYKDKSKPRLLEDGMLSVITMDLLELELWLRNLDSTFTSTGKLVDLPKDSTF